MLVEGRGGWNGAVGTRRCWRWPGGLPAETAVAPPGTAVDGWPGVLEKFTGGMVKGFDIGSLGERGGEWGRSK